MDPNKTESPKDVLLGMRERLAELESEIIELKNAIKYVEQFTSKMKHENDKPGPGPRDYRKLTVVEAVRDYLTLIGRPCTTREIADGIKAGGKKISYEKPIDSIYAILRNTGKAKGIVRIGKKWVLIEWNIKEEKNPED
jgi:hypothetical protein